MTISDYKDEVTAFINLVFKDEKDDILAKKIGVKRQTINNWRNGKCSPDFYHILKIIDVFNISLSTFIKGTLSEEIAIQAEKLPIHYQMRLLSYLTSKDMVGVIDILDKASEVLGNEN